MAVTLTLTGKTPGQTLFGLDSFTEHYKCDATADDVLTDASVPEMLSAHPEYSFMFVTNRHCDETGEKASALDLVYTGCIKETDPDTPALPSDRNTLDNPIQTATSYTSSAIFPAVATVPGSVQYRAHACVLVTWSTTDESDAVCPEPAAVTVADLITWTLAAEQPAGSFPGIAAWLLENAFVQYVVETTSAEEMVPGQYWQITKRKTMNLYPYAPAS
jgi:hypothetical protein